MKLDELPEEILLSAIKYSAVVDRVSFSKVSQRLRAVVAVSWRDVTCLRLAEFRFAAFEIVEEIFRACGHFLRSLDLSQAATASTPGGEAYFIDDALVDVIADNCCNIAQLNLASLHIPWAGLCRLCENLDLISSLTLDDTNDGELNDHTLGSIVCSLPRLTDLSVRGQTLLNGNFLYSLRGPLRSLSIGPCYFNSAVLAFVNSHSECLGALEKLNLKGCSLRLELLVAICELATSLKKVDIGNVQISANGPVAALSAPAFPTSLSELHAVACGVSLNCQFLSTNCRSLTSLCLASTGLTDADIVHLSRLDQLKLLDISSSLSINDWSLQLLCTRCHRLEELYCCDCLKLTGKGFLSSLFKYCTKLSKLGIYGCSLIENSTFAESCLDLVGGANNSDEVVSAATDGGISRRLVVFMGHTRINYAWLFNAELNRNVGIELDATACAEHSHHCKRSRF